MSNKEAVFDYIIDKTFKEIKGKTYFAPAGIYWKAYILESKEQVNELKEFLRKFLWIVLILIVISIFSFKPSLCFPLYISIIFFAYFISIMKAKSIQKQKKKKD
ncbi:MAG: hypothetical protein C0625_01670 [Arcobacter sp.]|nr:MAG: hypothetical protein C0625_01670 [Arcobacter sp.]